jgi:hypothetical protein
MGCPVDAAHFLRHPMHVWVSNDADNKYKIHGGNNEANPNE